MLSPGSNPGRSAMDNARYPDASDVLILVGRVSAMGETKRIS